MCTLHHSTQKHSREVLWSSTQNLCIHQSVSVQISWMPTTLWQRSFFPLTTKVTSENFLDSNTGSRFLLVFEAMVLQRCHQINWKNFTLFFPAVIFFLSVERRVLWVRVCLHILLPLVVLIYPQWECQCTEWRLISVHNTMKRYKVVKYLFEHFGIFIDFYFLMFQLRLLEQLVLKQLATCEQNSPVCKKLLISDSNGKVTVLFAVNHVLECTPFKFVNNSSSEWCNGINIK